MNKKIIFSISLILLVGLVVFVSAKNCEVKEDCYPAGFVPSNCGTFYSCMNSQCISGSNSCAVPNTTTGGSAPNPTAGTCPQGCTCTLNSVNCGPQSGTAPIPSAGTCPLECTCTENAISCTLGEESPSADVVDSETGAGSGQTEKDSSIVEITRNKEQQTMSINVGETKALTTAEVIIKERKLYVKSGETEKQVKVMPNTASEIAVERLGNLGFTIELKETGNYELKAEKQARFLFIFPLTAKVSASIDVETGKINSITKPWWSFLASGI